MRKGIKMLKYTSKSLDLKLRTIQVKGDKKKVHVIGSSKFLCLSPIIRGVLLGGRHQNVEESCTWTQDIKKTKFDLLGPPFNLGSKAQV